MAAWSAAIVAALLLGEDAPERPVTAEPPLPPPEKLEVPVLAFDGVVVVVDDPADPDEPVEDSSTVSALAKALSSVATVA
jgi:hypothetical protein